MSRALRNKIAAARRRYTTVTLTTAFAHALAMFLLLIGLCAVLDYASGLSLAWRAALLLANLATVSYILVRRAFIPIARGPDEEQLALWVERDHPTLASRLIASIQFTRANVALAGASPALVDALVCETETIASPMNFARVVKLDQLRRRVIFAGVILAAWAAVLLASPAAAGALFKRALLVPNVDRPHKTTLYNVTGDIVVARGQELTIAADARGVLPLSGKVLINNGSLPPREFSLDRASGDSPRYQRPVSNLQESFTYTLALNDATSPPYRVTVVDPPTAVSVRCKQTYPPYTGLPPVDRATGDLALLVGSTLQLDVQSSTPLKHAKLHVKGASEPIPMSIDAHDRTLATTSTPLPITAATTGFRIELVDDNGIASKDATAYAIDPLPDRAPTVKVNSTHPKDELITATGSLLIGIEAADDIALGKLSIHYRTSASTQSIELDIPPRVKSFRGRHLFAPKSIAIGTAIEWWIEAQDTNVPTPGKAESDHFTLRVVSDEEKRADLLARMSDRFKQINEVTETQQQLNTDLGKAILTPVAPGPLTPSPRTPLTPSPRMRGEGWGEGSTDKK